MIFPNFRTKMGHKMQLASQGRKCLSDNRVLDRIQKNSEQQIKKDKFVYLFIIFFLQKKIVK